MSLTPVQSFAAFRASRKGSAARIFVQRQEAVSSGRAVRVALCEMALSIDNAVAVSED
jgi:hypothetical protein